MPDWSLLEKRVLGGNLKRARLVAAKARPELQIGYKAAAAIGATPAMLTNWENGSVVPELPWLIQLALVYDTKIDRLLYGVDRTYNALLQRDWPLDVQEMLDAQQDELTERVLAILLSARKPAGRTRDSAPVPELVAAGPATAAGKSRQVASRRRRRK